jgi:serralysin
LSVGRSADGKTIMIKTATGTDTLENIGDLIFSDQNFSLDNFFASIPPKPLFVSYVTEGTEPVLPDTFVQPRDADGNVIPGLEYLEYQLIESAYNAVIVGGSSNDFIKVSSSNSSGKAVNGNGGRDVIDGGVGSTFISGGTGHAQSTFFLDGRAPGTAWSTITDFVFGSDMATIWGFIKGQSTIDATYSDPNNEGAAGYTGLTLHFNNLMLNNPDGSPAGPSPDVASITLSGHTLEDIGVTSLADLNNQIANATTPNEYGQYIINNHLIIGQTTDSLGVHGYLFVY